MENMRMAPPGSAARACSRRCSRRCGEAQEKRNTERADDLLGAFKLDEKRDDFAGSLSGGQRKLLEMARALMVEPSWSCSTSRWPGSTPR